MALPVSAQGGVVHPEVISCASMVDVTTRLVRMPMFMEPPLPALNPADARATSNSDGSVGDTN